MKNELYGREDQDTCHKREKSQVAMAGWQYQTKHRQRDCVRQKQQSATLRDGKI
jgi:hypothetical protein